MIRRYQILYTYNYVFPKELSGLPSKREFDVSTKLILGAKPIARKSYRITTIEM